MVCKCPKKFRLMGCLISFFSLAIAVVIIITLVTAFKNNADAFSIVCKFIYLFADLTIGGALWTLFFSYASFLDCDCDL